MPQPQVQLGWMPRCLNFQMNRVLDSNFAQFSGIVIGMLALHRLGFLGEHYYHKKLGVSNVTIKRRLLWDELYYVNIHKKEKYVWSLKPIRVNHGGSC